MVASGAACLGGAVAAKNRIGIAAATVMLLAMLDLVTLQLVPAPVWALLLVAAALALGARLRVGAPAVTSKARVSAGTGLRRAVNADRTCASQISLRPPHRTLVRAETRTFGAAIHRAGGATVALLRTDRLRMAGVAPYD